MRWKKVSYNTWTRADGARIKRFDGIKTSRWNIDSEVFVQHPSINTSESALVRHIKTKSGKSIRYVYYDTFSSITKANEAIRKLKNTLPIIN